jgi:hypothetical protein
MTPLKLKLGPVTGVVVVIALLPVAVMTMVVVVAVVAVMVVATIATMTMTMPALVKRMLPLVVADPREKTVVVPIALHASDGM